MDAKILSEFRGGFDIPDILLAGHRDTRPIRLSIDLFREHATQEEWDAFVTFQEKVLKAERDNRKRRKLVEILVMASNHRPILGSSEINVEVQNGKEGTFWIPVSVKSTERSRRVHAGTYTSWSDWFATAPDWFRDLLKLHLELWAIQFPETPAEDDLPEVKENGKVILKEVEGRPKNAVQGLMRKAFQMFYTGCFGNAGVWNNYDNIPERAAKLRAQISKIKVPHKGWTDFEVEALSGIPSGTLISMLVGDRLPPFTDEGCPSASRVRKVQQNRNPVEEAALAYVNVHFPNLAGRDVAAWPFQPRSITLDVEGVLRPVVLVFRSNGKSSKVPRLFHAFGSLNLMAKANEIDVDSNHPAYLGELNWSTDRVILLDGSKALFVRTWVNGTKTDGDIPFTKNGYLFAASALDEKETEKLIQKYRNKLKKSTA